MRGRRYSPVRFQRAFHSFQQIWNATAVLPVPVAIVKQQTAPTGEDGFDRAVDRDLLVVALAFADIVIGSAWSGAIGDCVLPNACSRRDIAPTVRPAFG